MYLSTPRNYLSTILKYFLKNELISTCTQLQSFWSTKYLSTSHAIFYNYKERKFGFYINHDAETTLMKTSRDYSIMKTTSQSSCFPLRSNMTSQLSDTAIDKSPIGHLFFLSSLRLHRFHISAHRPLTYSNVNNFTSPHSSTNLLSMLRVE